MQFIIEIERTILSRLPCFQLESQTNLTEYPNQENTTRVKIKHLMFGEWQVTAEEKEGDESGATDEEKIEQMVKKQLEKYRKRITQELREFRKDLVDDIRHLNSGT